MDLERKRAFVYNVLYFGIMLAFFVVLVQYALPMLMPFVLAVVIAYVLRRPTRLFSRKLRIPEKPMAMIMVLLFYCTVGFLIAILAVRVYFGVRDLVLYMPHLYTEHFEPALVDIFLRFEGMVFEMDERLFNLIQDYDEQALQWIASTVSGLSARAVGAASSVAAYIPSLFIQLVLMIISSFFIAADYYVIKHFLIRQMSNKTAGLFLQIKTYVTGTLFVCIGSYFIIASLTFVELSIGLRLLGVQHSMLVAFCIAIFDILPVLGTGGIMIPWALIAMLQGDFKLGLGLLVVYVIITVIRNIVEPKFVGSQLGLHPVVTLASMFAGAQLFGVVGLFGFPIGLSLLRYLNDNGSIRIMK